MIGEFGLLTIRLMNGKWINYNGEGSTTPALFAIFSGTARTSERIGNPLNNSLTVVSGGLSIAPLKGAR